MTRAQRMIHDQIKSGLHDLMKKEWPMIQLRLRVAEAAEYLRTGSPGRSLEVLESILEELEQQQNPAAQGKPPF